MSIIKNKDKLSKLWEESEYLKLGELLCKLIPASEQPRWFANFLDMVLHDEEKSGIIDSLLKVTLDESKWPESREIFNSLREQTLECEQSDASNFRRIGMLHLAENIAKVTFNSSGLEQPKFDSDSGYWIPQCIKYMIDHSENKVLNDTLVEYLVAPEFCEKV